jgi:hypothetical protein
MIRQPRLRRSVAWWAAASLVSVLLLIGSSAAAQAEHPVVGRWVLEAEPGGAVWTFQAGGGLVVTGPGDLISEGSWDAAGEPEAFDAGLRVDASGQQLEILGQVSDDGAAIAMYITATDASRPQDWTPWPPESRLIGYPLGMAPSGSPEPTVPPVECRRPLWVGRAVDWDRCDGSASTAEVPTDTASPSPAA